MRLAAEKARFAGTLALFIFSVYVLSWCAHYRHRLHFQPGVDPFLPLIPRVDLTFWLGYGWFSFHAGVFAFWLRQERPKLPYILAILSLYMMIRNVFILLTPVAAPAGIMPVYTAPWFSVLRETDSGEVFFSGHTAMPYLYFLLNAGHPRLRAFCLAVSMANAAAVLLTRNHYTIDVLGAYFITYSIYALGRRSLGWLKPREAVA